MPRCWPPSGSSSGRRGGPMEAPRWAPRGSFYVVFPTAEAAAAAAVRGQRALDAHAWPGDARVRARMGIHTGSPALVDGAYVGIDVVRAARISDAGHGGQIVVSAT